MLSHAFLFFHKAISQFEIKCSIDHYLTVSSVSFLCDEIVSAPDRYPMKIPIKLYLRTHCDSSIRGAHGHRGGYRAWSRGGGFEVTPSAPSVTDPMTPFTIQSPMRKPLMLNQLAVSHFITCHNDKSPGNDRAAHFTLMKCCDFADSLRGLLHKSTIIKVKFCE